MGKIFTIQQVSKKLQVSEKSVYRYIKSGRLKAKKIGQWRIDGKDLHKFINNNTGQIVCPHCGKKI